MRSSFFVTSDSLSLSFLGVKCKRMQKTQKAKTILENLAWKVCHSLTWLKLLLSSLLLLSLIKLWAREDRVCDSQEWLYSVLDLMLPGLTLVYILRPKKRMKTLIQDKLLQPDQLPPLVLLLFLSLKKALSSQPLAFSLVSPTISPLRILSPSIIGCYVSHL